MAAFPASGDGVVVMTNADRGQELAMEIVRGVSRGLDWPGFSPRRVQLAAMSQQEIDRFAGQYHFAGLDLTAVFAREGDHLILQTPRWGAFYPISKTTFIRVEDGEEATFALGERETILRIRGAEGRRPN
jgi:hypothetical protein